MTGPGAAAIARLKDEALNVVHVALTDPAAAARLQAPLQRLIHFLGNETEAAGSETVAVANDDIDTKGE